MMDYAEEGQATAGLETNIFLTDEYRKVADLKIGEKFFERATLNLRYNEVMLYDNVWLPGFYASSSATFLETESIERY